MPRHLRLSNMRQKTVQESETPTPCSYKFYTWEKKNKQTSWQHLCVDVLQVNSTNDTYSRILPSVSTVLKIQHQWNWFSSYSNCGCCHVTKADRDIYLYHSNKAIRLDQQQTANVNHVGKTSAGAAWTCRLTTENGSIAHSMCHHGYSWDEHDFETLIFLVIPPGRLLLPEALAYNTKV